MVIFGVFNLGECMYRKYMKNVRKDLFVILFIISFTMPSLCFSQTIEQIKHSNKYIWGEALSTNPNFADKNALSNLISQISVSVESKFTNVVEEYDGDIKDYSELVVNTYSNVMLKEAKMIQEKIQNKFLVLRYMEKDNVNNIFSDRKDMIMDFINSGYNAKKNLRIGDALMYYYWSLCLLRSHPEMEEITGEEAGMPGRLFTRLPETIECILDSVKINIQSANYIPEEKRKRIIFNITYGGKPVSNLDYIYFTGSNWTSRLTTATDGLGLVDLYGAVANTKNMKEVRLRLEYVYSSKCKHNTALNAVIENTYIPYFSKAEKIASSIFIKKTPEKDKVFSEVIGDLLINVDNKDKKAIQSENNKYIQTILNFKEAFEIGSFDEISDQFTPEGRFSIKKLLNYGNAELIHTGEIKLQMVKLNDKYIIRSIPFKFNFPFNNREFIEDVVFILNEEAKICGINFALSDKSINDIMYMGNDFGSIEQKQQIIYFMESYKTAYCLEDLDYIEKIFSDNALIIIGQKIKAAENIDSIYSNRLSNEEVNYIKMDKSDYLKRLNRLFENNETINIHFEETKVKKVIRPNDYIYGIQIAQNYYSTNYADFGYLFLMFDLNNPEEPKIYVRSWQPEKNNDGRIVGLEDFVLN